MGFNVGMTGCTGLHRTATTSFEQTKIYTSLKGVCFCVCMWKPKQQFLVQVWEIRCDIRFIVGILEDVELGSKIRNVASKIRSSSLELHWFRWKTCISILYATAQLNGPQNL